MQALFIAASLAIAQAGVSGGVQPVEPRSFASEIDGRPTEVAVFGTMHLSGIAGFQTDWAAHVVDRLAAWQPDLVLIEQLPAGEIEMMRQDPEFDPVIDRSARRAVLWADQARETLATTRSATAAELARPLGPDAGPAERRRRAALYLLAYDPASALVHWLALPEAERRPGDGLNPTLVEALNAEITRQNETTLIAAPLAHHLGHERVYPFDSQAEKAAYTADVDAIMTAFEASTVMTETLQGPDAAALQSVSRNVIDPESLLASLVQMNSPEHQAIDVSVQWASFARADMDGLGRTRVAYWESRNYAMAAHARRLMARHPGQRILIIVGAAHKPYLDDLLDRSMDIEIIDTQALLE